MVNDTAITQSQAIGRFVAREFNLYGSTNLEHTRIDEIIDFLHDLIEPSMDFLFTEKDEEKIKEKKAKYFKELIPNLEMLGKLLGEKEYFLGDKLSYADIGYFAGFEFVALKGEGNPEVEESLSKVPNLKKLYDRVANIPAIAEWRKTRPQNPF